MFVVVEGFDQGEYFEFFIKGFRRNSGSFFCMAIGCGVCIVKVMEEGMLGFFYLIRVLQVLLVY